MCNNTNLRNKITQIKGSNGVPLDTLAQLTTGEAQQRKKYINRQKAKAITLAQLFPLINLDSRLKKSYWRTYHCNRLILQEGYNMTTKYCNGRWCTVCNRIRMAKMINAYSLPLLSLKNLYFVTLTLPNVKAEDLSKEIDRMYQSFRAINQNIRKTYKINLKGMRKLECTYNPHTDTYNPHFHLMLDGERAAELFISLWLQRHPEATRKAQDMRKAKEGSLIELFKYTVKGVHKGKYHPEALDQIYQAFENRRTYQPFGIAKVVDEDISGIKSEAVTFKGNENNNWSWSKNAKDWVNQDGELFTEYVIEGKLTDWIEQLTESVDSELVEPDREQTTIRLNKREFNDAKWSIYSELTDEIVNNSS